MSRKSVRLLHQRGIAFLLVFSLLSPCPRAMALAPSSRFSPDSSGSGSEPEAPAPQPVFTDQQRVMGKGEGLSWKDLKALQKFHREKGSMDPPNSKRFDAQEMLRITLSYLRSETKLSGDPSALTFHFIEDITLSGPRKHQEIWVDLDNTRDVYINLTFWNQQQLQNWDRKALLFFGAAQALKIAELCGAQRIQPRQATPQILNAARDFAQRLTVLEFDRSEFGLGSSLDDSIALMRFLRHKADDMQNSVNAQRSVQFIAQKGYLNRQPVDLPSAFFAVTDRKGRLTLPKSAGLEDKFRELDMRDGGGKPYLLEWEYNGAYGWILNAYAHHLGTQEADKKQAIAQFAFDDRQVIALRQKSKEAFSTQAMLQLEEIAQRADLDPLSKLCRDVPVDLEELIHELYPGDYPRGDLVVPLAFLLGKRFPDMGEGYFPTAVDDALPDLNLIEWPEEISSGALSLLEERFTKILYSPIAQAEARGKKELMDVLEACVMRLADVRHAQVKNVLSKVLDAYGAALVFKPADWGLKADVPLRLFQRLDLLAAKDKKKFMLANEQGLGKSLTVIADALHKKAKKVLILTRVNAMSAWENEIAKWAARPHKVHKITGGSAQEKLRLLSEVSENPAETEFIIMSDMAFGNEDMLDAAKALNADYICVDEAHRIQNPESIRSSAIRELQAENQVLVSGTPLTGGDIKWLWALLNWVAPERFPGLDPADFEERYAGGLEKMAHLYFDMKPYKLRWLKSQVLSDFPRRKYTTREVTLAGPYLANYQRAHKELMDEQKADMRTVKKHVYDNKLAAFSIARDDGTFDWNDPRVMESPKIQAIREIAREKFAKGEKVVFFTEYVAVAELVQKVLTEVLKEIKPGYESILSVGSPGEAVDKRNIDRFQDDAGNALAFVTTYKKSSEAITLNKAKTLVEIDLPWNPTERKQANARIERLGQKHGAEIITLIARGTIDERIAYVLERKGLINNVVVDGKFFLDEEIDEDTMREVFDMERNYSPEAHIRKMMREIQELSRGAYWERIARIWDALSYEMDMHLEKLSSYAINLAMAMQLLRAQAAKEIHLSDKPCMGFFPSGPAAMLRAFERMKSLWEKAGIPLGNMQLVNVDCAAKMLEVAGAHAGGAVREDILANMAIDTLSVAPNSLDLACCDGLRAIPHMPQGPRGPDQIAEGKIPEGVSHRVWALAQIAHAVKPGGVLALSLEGGAMPAEMLSLLEQRFGMRLIHKLGMPSEIPVELARKFLPDDAKIMHKFLEATKGGHLVLAVKESDKALGTDELIELTERDFFFEDAERRAAKGIVSVRDLMPEDARTSGMREREVVELGGYDLDNVTLKDLEKILTPEALSVAASKAPPALPAPASGTGIRMPVPSLREDQGPGLEILLRKDVPVRDFSGKSLLSKNFVSPSQLFLLEVALAYLDSLIRGKGPDGQWVLPVGPPVPELVMQDTSLVPAAVRMHFVLQELRDLGYDLAWRYNKWPEDERATVRYAFLLHKRIYGLAPNIIELCHLCSYEPHIVRSALNALQQDVRYKKILVPAESKERRARAPVMSVVMASMESGGLYRAYLRWLDARLKRVRADYDSVPEKQWAELYGRDTEAIKQYIRKFVDTQIAAGKKEMVFPFKRIGAMPYYNEGKVPGPVFAFFLFQICQQDRRKGIHWKPANFEPGADLYTLARAFREIFLTPPRMEELAFLAGKKTERIQSELSTLKVMLQDCKLREPDVEGGSMRDLTVKQPILGCVTLLVKRIKSLLDVSDAMEAKLKSGVTVITTADVAGTPAVPGQAVSMDIQAREERMLGLLRRILEEWLTAHTERLMLGPDVFGRMDPSLNTNAFLLYFYEWRKAGKIEELRVFDFSWFHGWDAFLEGLAGDFEAVYGVRPNTAEMAAVLGFGSVRGLESFLRDNPKYVEAWGALEHSDKERDLKPLMPILANKKIVPRLLRVDAVPAAAAPGVAVKISMSAEERETAMLAKVEDLIADWKRTQMGPVRFSGDDRSAIDPVFLRSPLALIFYLYEWSRTGKIHRGVYRLSDLGDWKYHLENAIPAFEEIYGVRPRAIELLQLFDLTPLQMDFLKGVYEKRKASLNLPDLDPAPELRDLACRTPIIFCKRLVSTLPPRFKKSKAPSAAPAVSAPDQEISGPIQWPRPAPREPMPVPPARPVKEPTPVLAKPVEEAMPPLVPVASELPVLQAKEPEPVLQQPTPLVEPPAPEIPAPHPPIAVAKPPAPEPVTPPAPRMYAPKAPEEVPVNWRAERDRVAAYLISLHEAKGRPVRAEEIDFRALDVGRAQTMFIFFDLLRQGRLKPGDFEFTHLIDMEKTIEHVHSAFLQIYRMAPSVGEVSRAYGHIETPEAFPQKAKQLMTRYPNPLTFSHSRKDRWSLMKVFRTPFESEALAALESMLGPLPEVMQLPAAQIEPKESVAEVPATELVPELEPAPDVEPPPPVVTTPVAPTTAAATSPVLPEWTGPVWPYTGFPEEKLYDEGERLRDVLAKIMPKNGKLKLSKALANPDLKIAGPVITMFLAFDLISNRTPRWGRGSFIVDMEDMQPEVALPVIWDAYQYLYNDDPSILELSVLFGFEKSTPQMCVLADRLGQQAARKFALREARGPLQRYEDPPDHPLLSLRDYWKKEEPRLQKNLKKFSGEPNPALFSVNQYKDSMDLLGLAA